MRRNLIILDEHRDKNIYPFGDTSIKPKPCPFCGSSNIKIGYIAYNPHGHEKGSPNSVVCYTCNVQITLLYGSSLWRIKDENGFLNDKELKEILIKMWNQRSN